MSIEDRMTAPADAGGEGSAAPQTQGAEAPQEVSTEAPAQQAPQTNGAAEPAPSYEMESEARSMGWVPETEWRGSKDAWRPAGEFVKRGKEVLPIVRSQLDRERRRVADLEAKLVQIPGELDAAWSERFARMEKMHNVALQKQADNIYRSFEEQKLKAVSEGDQNEYKRIVNDQRQAIADLHAGFEEAEPPPQQRQPQKQQAPAHKPPAEVGEWIQKNANWFNRDAVLTAAAIEHHGHLMTTAPGMAVDENLRRVDGYLRQKFPERFGIDPQAQQRAHAPAVEGGARQPQGANRAKGWSDVPEADRKVAERSLEYFMPDGVSADRATEEHWKKARSDWAREYWSQG